MPATAMTTGHRADLCNPIEQAPQAGDAHVVDLDRRLAMVRERSHRLLRDRHVRCAGGHHRDPGGTRRRRLAEHRGARNRVVIERGAMRGVDGVEQLRVEPGKEHRPARVHAQGENRVDLARGLAGAEDRLVEADALVTRVVGGNLPLRHGGTVFACVLSRRRPARRAAVRFVVVRRSGTAGGHQECAAHPVGLEPERPGTRRLRPCVRQPCGQGRCGRALRGP